MATYVHLNDLPNGLFLENDIAIDTETMGLQHQRDRLCVLQLTDGQGDIHLVHFRDKNYRAPNLCKLLNEPGRCFLFHFARFDVAVIYRSFNILLTKIYCTKIASKLVRTYTNYHGLKNLCYELLNISLSKQQQSSYWGAFKLNQEQIDYAALDVMYLHQLRTILDKMLKREDKLELFTKCCEFLPQRAKLDLLGWENADIFAHQS